MDWVILGFLFLFFFQRPLKIWGSRQWLCLSWTRTGLGFRRRHNHLWTEIIRNCFSISWRRSCCLLEHNAILLLFFFFFLLCYMYFQLLMKMLLKYRFNTLFSCIYFKSKCCWCFFSFFLVSNSVKTFCRDSTYLLVWLIHYLFLLTYNF